MLEMHGLRDPSLLSFETLVKRDFFFEKETIIIKKTIVNPLRTILRLEITTKLQLKKKRKSYNNTRHLFKIGISHQKHFDRPYGRAFDKTFHREDKQLRLRQNP